MKEFEPQRKIIHNPGEPETLDALETRTREYFAASPQSPEFKKFLESIDFKLLKKIFHEVATRCGISKEAFNFIEPERIVRKEVDGFSGQLLPMYNSIMLREPMTDTNYGWLGAQEKERQRQRDRQRSEKLAGVYENPERDLLHTLIHEETHGVSRNIVLISMEYIYSESSTERHKEGGDKKYVDDLYTQTGFHTIRSEGFSYGFHKYRGNNAEGIIKDDKLVRKYRGFSTFNEGVTEKLSREVMLRYLEESGAGKDEIEIVKKFFLQNEELNVYYIEVAIVDQIVRQLALKNGQSEKVAWEALVHAYFQGENFEDPQIEQLFAETFGPDFIKDLSKLYVNPFMIEGAHDPREGFMKKYNLTK